MNELSWWMTQPSRRWAVGWNAPKPLCGYSWPASECYHSPTTTRDEENRFAYFMHMKCPDAHLHQSTVQRLWDGCQSLRQSISWRLRKPRLSLFWSIFDDKIKISKASQTRRAFKLYLGSGTANVRDDRGPQFHAKRWHCCYDERSS